MKVKQDVDITELRDVLDDYEDVRDEVHVKIALNWGKICTAANAGNLHEVVEVSHAP